MTQQQEHQPVITDEMREAVGKEGEPMTLEVSHLECVSRRVTWPLSGIWQPLMRRTSLTVSPRSQSYMGTGFSVAPMTSTERSSSLSVEGDPPVPRGTASAR